MLKGCIYLRIEGEDSVGQEISSTLAPQEYSEVSSQGMTGGEDLVIWLVPIIASSPVIIKLIGLLEKIVAQKQIAKITVIKDGSVSIQGATAKDAIKILNSIKNEERS